MTDVKMRIGTRGSPLALAQTLAVRDALAAAHGWAPEMLEVVAIKTTGDAITDRPLGEAGGKGLFTKELDVATLEGHIDLAVHSAKDLPTLIPSGIAIAGYTRREDPRDVLISAKAKTVRDLPRGGRVGTASLRRAAQVKRLRPDIETVLLRGNVETRLRKAETGELDATFLALAGLKRLGLAERATTILDLHEFLPAVGQGAVAITARAGDRRTVEALAPILCDDTAAALAAERAFLTVLDGSCRTPIAGYASTSDGRVSFAGIVLRVDGREVFEARGEGDVSRAAIVGADAGREILRRLPAGILVSH